LKNKILSLALACSALHSAPAIANIVKYSSELANFDSTISLTMSTPTVTEVNAGSMANFVANGNYSFVAFCIEMEQSPWSTNPYNRTIIPANDPRYGNLAKLYNTWYDVALTSGAGISAFSAALREVQYDSGKNLLNFGTGIFKLTAGPANVVSLANQMLATVSDTSTVVPSGWEFTVWGNPVDQDLLEGKRSAVSAPLTPLLLLIGLAGFVAVGRKNQA
jgi:hypothetical protein